MNNGSFSFRRISTFIALIKAFVEVFILFMGDLVLSAAHLTFLFRQMMVKPWLIPL